MRRTREGNEATKIVLASFFFIMMILLGFVSLLANNVEINENVILFEVASKDFKPEPEVYLFGQKASWPVSISGTVDAYTVGEYTCEYVPYFSFKKFYQTIKVIDTQSPLIALNGALEMTLQSIDDYEESGFTAVDNYDGIITDQVVTNLKQCQKNLYEIEYSVKDSSDNETTVKRTIHLVSGKVYLTFDDGPSHSITPKILDLLKEKNVKATFFVLGYDESKEEIVKRAYEEGHTIAMHGYSHTYSEIYSDIDTLLENFHKIEDMVEETTGAESSKLIRFPGGSSNTVSKKYCVGIMSEAVERVTEEGYTYYDWNVDGQDAGGADTAEEIYQNVIDGIKPGRSNVVLLHDSGGHEDTLTALEWIIDYCIDNNYVLESLTQETRPVVHHNVVN